MDQEVSIFQGRAASTPIVSSIEGVVQSGQQLARTLGFPTANVSLSPDFQPTYGVYAALTRLSDGRVIPGVASVGVRPTVGGVEPLLEVWLFDFDENLYGSKICTDLVQYIRPELKFENLEILTRQVMLDAEDAKRILSIIKYTQYE